MPGLFRRPPQPTQLRRTVLGALSAPTETNAPAELASATGEAYAASVDVQPTAAPAAATGEAYAASANVQPTAGNAAGRGGLVGDLSGFLDARSTAGVALRLRSSSPGFGVSYIAAVLASGADVELRISRYDNPTSTTLASVIVFTSESIDQRWNVRFDVWGEPTAIVARARLWHDADAEPTTWQAGATDNYPTGARADLYEGDLLGGSGTLHEASVVYILPPPSISIEPTAGNAAATGAASQPAASIAPVAGHASGTGAAYDATVETGTATNADAGHASASAAALDATVTVDVTAGNAAAAGTAYDATVSTETLVEADAEVAAATGAANQPSISVSVNAGHAAATAGAFGIAGLVALGPDVASAIATAYDATVSVTGEAVNVNAGHASATATAYNATVDNGEVIIPPLGGHMRPAEALPVAVFARAGVARAMASTGGVYVRAEWLLDDALLGLDEP